MSRVAEKAARKLAHTINMAGGTLGEPALTDLIQSAMDGAAADAHAEDAQAVEKYDWFKVMNGKELLVKHFRALAEKEGHNG